MPGAPYRSTGALVCGCGHPGRAYRLPSLVAVAAVRCRWLPLAAVSPFLGAPASLPASAVCRRRMPSVVDGEADPEDAARPLAGLPAHRSFSEGGCRRPSRSRAAGALARRPLPLPSLGAPASLPASTVCCRGMPSAVVPILLVLRILLSAVLRVLSPACLPTAALAKVGAVAPDRSRAAGALARRSLFLPLP